MDYETKRSGFDSSYIRQACRNLTKRIKYHQKDDTPVTQHVAESCVQSRVFELNDSSNEIEKLLLMNILHMKNASSNRNCTAIKETESTKKRN